MASGQEFVILISIFLAVSSAQNGVRGPPQAEQKELKKVGKIGENIKLVCPIFGFPTPIVEWTKNGEKIDYMWERHRTTRKALKINKITEEDTGIFTCKGINGFGSEEVRIELLVVDPMILPPGIDDSMSVAPPMFTYDTKQSQKVFSQKIGDTFKVSCEALGSPEPEIFWFKDGQHIDEHVHYKRGRSTVEFNIFGTADGGVYTCRARNLIGEKTVNFTLDVKEPLGGKHAIVTEVGPTNTTVLVGGEATLQCKVKSLIAPHIKWLKKMEPNEKSSMNTLTVGADRYRILRAEGDISVGNDEYLNKLVIGQASLQDAGLYICFVTNGGFGALTYKAMTLRVEKPGPNIVIDTHPGDDEGSNDLNGMLILVICLAVAVFTILLVIFVYVCARKHKEKNNASETQSSTDCSEVGRPFMPQNYQQHPQTLVGGIKNNNLMVNKPLPPTPMTLGQWNNAIHPKLYGADSGFNEQDTTKDMFEPNVNQYEVPYAHLLRPYNRAPEEIYFTQEAFLNPQSINVRNYSRNTNTSAAGGSHSRYYKEYETQ